MRLKRDGESISPVEVQNISSQGFWLFVSEKEYFLSFEEFPWFKEAKVTEILNVTLPQSHHLYWPDLDINLEMESLQSADKFPLVDRENQLHNVK